MTSQLNPYLGFRDDAKQAMEFYHSVFGGDLTTSTFGEMHASEDPTEADKIMHSQLETPSGYTLMAADTPNHMEFSPGGSHSMSLSGDGAAQEELTGYFQGLSDGGTVALPLERAPWGDYFGMVIDRFGVQWLVNITGVEG
ncbi:VOC family protein [soil metagenome]